MVMQDGKRAVKEYLELDDAAFGAASAPPEVRFASDPPHVDRAMRGPILRLRRQLSDRREVGSSWPRALSPGRGRRGKTMVERTEERFDIKPWVAADRPRVGGNAHWLVKTGYRAHIGDR